jgi:hypothetical protein
MRLVSSVRRDGGDKSQRLFDLVNVAVSVQEEKDFEKRFVKQDSASDKVVNGWTFEAFKLGSTPDEPIWFRVNESLVKVRCAVCSFCSS